MATRKITQLTELAATPHDDDEFIIVDVSDTSMSPEGTNKRIKASNLPTGGGGGSATFDASTSLRVNASYFEDWYYGNGSYGWNYVNWNLKATSFATLYYKYTNNGITVPAAFTSATIRGAANNSVALLDIEFTLWKTSHPDGSATSLPLTQLVQQTITMTTADVYYKIDATAAVTVSEDDILFFTVRRTSGTTGTLTINVNCNLTITLS